MATIAELQWQKTKRRLIVALVLAVILALYFVLTGPQLGQVLDGLTPPDLPEVVEREQVALDQNWDAATQQKFRNISQGTETIPMPLNWFLALEQPRSSPFILFFGSEKGFADSEYLQRLGFIAGKESEDNPHGLPIGFGITPYQSIAGTSFRGSAVGLTCAACHTGRLTVDNKDYIVDGGSASIDLGLLTKAIGAAIGQTLISSKLPVFDGRFERFAHKVLKTDYSDGNKLKLAAQLDDVITRLAGIPSRIKTIEGHSRLDALNRIGNEVFAVGPHRYNNYVPIEAPVNFPHLWTSSWFDWVQYDGSIMQPMIRNAGEALGVNASMDTTSPKEEHRFSSSVNMNNMLWIEHSLAGPAPAEKKKFQGLLPPVWPDAFPALDDDLVTKGEGLYKAYCQGCHLAPLNSAEIWGNNKDGQPYLRPVTYYVENVKKETRDDLLAINIITLDQIGTDPGQSRVLQNRTINTSSTVIGAMGEKPQALGIDTSVCTWAPDDHTPGEAYTGKLVNISMTDSANLNFGLALGAIVQEANDAWYDQNYITGENREYYQSFRPNCLQVGKGYKARPLNGVWATAPFLHNGSVPTIMDLLGPPEDRPNLVQLGSSEFDLNNIGIYQDPDVKPEVGESYVDGLFILDTSLSGNSNRGHEFSDEFKPKAKYWEQKKGVIGPALPVEDRQAIIEFLKTLDTRG